MDVKFPQKLNIPDDANVGNKGVEFPVKDAGEHFGDLVVQSKGIVWCPGKVSVRNGYQVSWSDLEDVMKAGGITPGSAKKPAKKKKKKTP